MFYLVKRQREEGLKRERNKEFGKKESPQKEQKERDEKR